MKPRELLIRDYLKLRNRLMRRFGSADFATEILHETYLRLGAVEPTVAVRNPDAYLYRTALNVAADAREADRRWIDKATVEAALRRDDHELDPAEIFEARREWRALLAALDELPRGAGPSSSPRGWRSCRIARSRRGSASRPTPSTAS